MWRTETLAQEKKGRLAALHRCSRAQLHTYLAIIHLKKSGEQKVLLHSDVESCRIALIPPSLLFRQTTISNELDSSVPAADDCSYNSSLFRSALSLLCLSLYRASLFEPNSFTHSSHSTLYLYQTHPYQRTWNSLHPSYAMDPSIQHDDTIIIGIDFGTTQVSLTGLVLH